MTDRSSAASLALGGGNRASTGLISRVSTVEPTGGPFMLLPREAQFSGYEAANASPVRGYLWFPEMSSRRDLPAHSDMEIRKRIKWLYINFPICRRIIKGYAKLIGIQAPQPDTKNDTWNEFVFDHFVAHAGSAEYFDRKGRFDYFTSQTIINEHRYRDGRLLGVHTETATGGAAMAFYEADQICDPDGYDHGFEQGVLTDDFDKHVAYNLRDGKNPDKNVVIPASNCTYFGNFESFNSIHGVSLLVSMVCDMMDIVELRGLRKHAAKNAADLGLVIERDGVGAPSSGSGGAVGPIVAQKIKTPDGKEQTVHYEVLTQQGVVPRLNPGEKMRVVMDDRPSPNNMAMENALIESCILAGDLPPAALYFIAGRGMPGPAIRFNMAEIERFIAIKHSGQRTERHQYYVRYVARQIKRYERSGGKVGIPPHPDGAPWWNEVLYIGMPDPTIDRGRDAMATVVRLDSGLTTWTAEYAKDGRFGKRALREKVRETAWLKREIADAAADFEVDLTLGEVIPRLAGVGLQDVIIPPREIEDDIPVIEGGPQI